MIRIWLIEDDSMYASMLKHQIEKNENYSVEVFPKADEIVKGELELPDAIFLDYQLLFQSVRLIKLKSIYPIYLNF